MPSLRAVLAVGAGFTVYYAKQAFEKFSIERYQQVIDACLRGLSARAGAGEPVDHIVSVASFLRAYKRCD